MVVVPLRQQANDFEPELRASEAECMSWVGYAAGGTLIAGGLLLLAGKRRAGTVAAAAGAALTLLDQVQETVEELAIQREKLRQILAR